MAPSRHDWKIVDWDVKPQHNQPTYYNGFQYVLNISMSTHFLFQCILLKCFLLIFKEEKDNLGLSCELPNIFTKLKLQQ